MNLKKSWYILALLLILLVGILTVPAIADAGGFSGNSDYGGSSGGDWGGSSDWGSSDYDYYSGSGSSDGDDDGSGLLGGIVIVAAILIISAIVGARKSKSGKGSSNAGGTLTNAVQLMPIQSLKDADVNFSQDAMKEKIANLYVQMQNAWQDKEFDRMRPHMTDALFSQFARQLDQMVRENCTNYVERIAVLSVELVGWTQDEINDSLVAVLNTRIVDYTVNDKTGQLVSGSKTAEKFMCYEWTLIRSKGMTTAAPAGEGSEGTVSIHCPSCGAPVEINQSAKCPYCDSLISAKDYDWSISAIKGISQRTGN